MSLSELNTILDRDIIAGVAREIATPEGLLLTGDANPYVPSVPYNSRKISFDIQYAVSGVAHAAGQDDVPAESNHPAVEQITVEAPVWRRRWKFMESDFSKYRRPGTQSDLYTRQAVTAHIVGGGMTSLRWTKEWATFQALSGTLTVILDKAPSQTINYRQPASLSPTAPTLWDVTGSSNPLLDLSNWVDTLTDDWGAEPGLIVFGSKVNKYLINSAAVQAVVSASGGGEEMLRSGRIIPQGTLLGIPHAIYRKSYVSRDYLDAAYTSGTTMTLRHGAKGELAGIGANDTVVIGQSSHTANKGARESVGVTSLSGNTLTIDGAMTNAFQVGDMVTWHRRFLPDNIVLILPKPDGEPWMQWWDIPSMHNNDQPGVYTVEDVRRRAPLEVDFTVGTDGLPVIIRQGRHVWATVA